MVTGSEGFLGSNVSNELTKCNYEVINIDITKRYHEDVNIQNILLDSFVDRYKDEDIKAIYYLSGPCSVIQFNKEPLSCINSSIQGLYNIIRLAKFTNAKVLMPSSGNVYGNIQHIMEERAVPKPDNLYAVTKLAMERILLNAEVSSCIFRIFAGYGNYEEHKGDIANPITIFLNSMIKNESPLIYGDGNQTRDFVYVKDIAKLFVKALMFGHIGLYNLGTGVSYSFNDIIAKLNERLGKDIFPKYIPKPSSYVNNTKAEMSTTKSVFQHIPTSLDDGLKEYISYLGY
jgi:UDP-glucose 4-epimerase